MPERLLDRPEFRAVLVWRGGRVVAGAAVFTTDGFAGVSNLFAHEDSARAWSTLAHHLLADPLTRAVGGYEHGCDLSAALAAGARELGPLTVWRRGPGRSRGWDRTTPDRPTLPSPAVTPKGSGRASAALGRVDRGSFRPSACASLWTALFRAGGPHRWTIGERDDRASLPLNRG